MGIANPKARLPEEGYPEREVDGVTYYIAKKTEPAGSRQQRLMAICPKCNVHIPSGRLEQHMKRKDHLNG